MDRRIVQSIDESDEEGELEALRLAALRSRRQTESYAQKRKLQRNKKDIRHVSLGCDERSVVEIGSPKTDECVSSSSTTDYEEIDLSGTYPDSEENENVFAKEESISDTPSDFENVEENGNLSGEEEVYFDSDITQDQSLDVETEGGIVDNLTITFSNEAGENELGRKTSSVTQSDEEEEGGDEDKEEEEEEELEVAIEDNPEEESASASGSDVTEQQIETREIPFHTRIIIADSDSEEGGEEVDLMDRKGTDSKESALFNKSKHEVSAIGPVGAQLTSVQTASKCSSGELAAKTIMQKVNVAASRKHLIMEDLASKSTFATKMGCIKVKKKENERASDDNFSKESKFVIKAHAIQDSAPKKVMQKEIERASCDQFSKEYPLSNSSTQKAHKQKDKHIALNHDKILKKDSLSKAKPANETSPQVTDQREKEGRKNSSRTRSCEDEKIAAVVTSRKSVPLKATLSQDSARTVPQPKKELEHNDADRLSIGTSDEDNEFEQSEEPAIKSKVGVNKMAASSNSHTTSRDRSRHRRSRSHDKSNSPRKAWSYGRDRGTYRSYDRSCTRDSYRMHGFRSESRGRTRYSHSPVRSRRARVHDRSREETTYASNQWRHSERSQLVDQRKDRRSDRQRSARSRSRETDNSQRRSVSNRDKRNDRKRSWSFDSPPPPNKSRPTVDVFGNKLTNDKGCSERTSSRFEKSREKDKIKSNENKKHSKPRKEIKAVMINGQKESACTSLPSKQDVKQERKRSKDESDLRVKLKDPLNNKTVEKKSSKIAVNTETTRKELPGKRDEKKVKVSVAQKTDNDKGEEELNTRIEKIRQRNKNILKRAREVKADKEKATHSRSRIL